MHVLCDLGAAARAGQASSPPPSGYNRSVLTERPPTSTLRFPLRAFPMSDEPIFDIFTDEIAGADAPPTPAD